ncbi:MAG: hypothetical protein NE330_01825 [Lentisphaeraceae bacterium]|nr:hypothetical protein [Lentisphaeraceae bacterium]
MTVSGLATVATFNMPESVESKTKTTVDSNGLPLVSASAIPHEKSTSEDMSLSELRQLDKEVRNRRDAQIFLSGGAINSATTFMKDVADQQFAVDLNMDVDLTTERSPEATVRKMRNILTASGSVSSPTKKDIGVNLMAMAIMNDARIQMQKEIRNEAYGIPRSFGSMGQDFSMNMGTNNFSATAHTDSSVMNFRTTSQLSGLLVNTFA